MYELRASEIARLCEALPAQLHTAPLQFQPERAMTRLGINDPIIARYLFAYRDLSFRWNYARALAMNNLPYPAWLRQDYAMWKAWLWCKDQKTWKDPALS